jgi:pyrroloquinoline quinone biosynthesis protein E
MLDRHSSDWLDHSFRFTHRAKIRKHVPVRGVDGEYRLLRFLLGPESSFPLELSEAAVLEFCDGATTLRGMVDSLAGYFNEEPTESFAEGITGFLSDLVQRRYLSHGPAPSARALDHRDKLDALCAEYSVPCPQPAEDMPIPRGLLAELSYRCPLHCPYCSNPLELSSQQRELTGAEWARALHEASKLGVLHVGFSGGEPLVRSDLAELVSAAHEAEIYSNLLTSGVGLTPKRAGELKQRGLDSIQISFQDTQEEGADEIAGADVHAVKLQAMRLARELDLPLTLNIVLHARNIDRIESIIEFAVEQGAERLELANVQFYGWALRNRDQLIPSRAQVEHSAAVAQRAQETLRGKMEVLYVMPDYFGTRPKPCMQGWGRQHLTINPTGEVLPCPTAFEIPGMRFDNVRARSLGDIWARSEAFTRFRGTAWMPDPCKSCDFRLVDFGGCRCQAAILAGDATVTDPACELSPYRQRLEDYLASQVNNAPAAVAAFLYRGRD